jgi:tRNA threonylcarbamoyl adenosine modification protein YeaZ
VNRAAILAIDTSGSFCSVALRGENGQVFERVSLGAGDHFEQLPRLVSAVCDDARIVVSSLCEIRVGAGPGSFTGLRIGMSYAKGLAVGVHAPLVPVSSFYGAALRVASATPEAKRIMVVSDARRDEVFLGQFEVHGGRCEEIGPESIVSRGQLLQVVTAHPGCLVVSPLKGFTIEGVPLLEEPLLAAGLLLAESSRAPYSVGEVALVEPNYVRGVSAKTIEERRGEERGLTLC